MKKVELTCVKIFFRGGMENFHTRTQKFSDPKIFKNLKIRIFGIFENDNFFTFCSFHAKLFILFRFARSRAYFSKSLLLYVQMLLDFPNSRVKKPQIQVIPHDDTYLSPARVAWHTTGANMRPRKYTRVGMKMGSANSEGSANLRRIRTCLAGVEKTQNTQNSKMTNPYYYPVLFFVFQKHQKTTFSRFLTFWKVR